MNPASQTYEGYLAPRFETRSSLASTRCFQVLTWPRFPKTGSCRVPQTAKILHSPTDVTRLPSLPSEIYSLPAEDPGFRIFSRQGRARAILKHAEEERGYCVVSSSRLSSNQK